MTGPERIGIVRLDDGWHPAAVFPGRKGMMRAVLVTGAGGQVGVRRVPASAVRPLPQGGGCPRKAWATLCRLAGQQGTLAARRLLGID